MVQRYVSTATVILGSLMLAACDSGSGRENPPASKGGQAPNGVVDVARADLPAAATKGKRKGFDPIVIAHFRVTVINRQDVPSQREGVVLKILVKEGDEVEDNQDLIQLDDRLAKADFEIKSAKLIASEADFVAAVKTKEEAAKRFETAQRLYNKGTAISFEELRGAELTWQRYISEEVSKKQAIRLAKEELKQSQVLLEMHTVKSSTKGVVKSIFKKPGETIKSLDTLLQLHNVDRVRVEGLVDVQYLPRLRQGMKVVIEPTQAVGPLITLRTYSEINGVAVSNDVANPLIVAGCEDCTARVWDKFHQQERMVLRHPAAVRSVACTGPKAKANLLLTGAADGKTRLWDLAGAGDKPPVELTGQGPHRGAVTSVAFSPDGSLCATGGEDKEIYLWDTNGGHRYKLPSVHRGPITTLQFAKNNQLLSAARDNTVQLWQLGAQEAQPLNAHFPRRSGDVAALGVSPDGTRLLFDQGKALCLMTLPQGFTQAHLQNISGTGNFTTFALFAPHGRLIATTGGSDGRIQLWRSPDDKLRGYELRQMVTNERSTPTCAAFAPDGSFLVTGSRERQLFVWPMPTTNEDIDQKLQADITFIDREVTAGSRQVRIWAELPNPKALLNPGMSAALVVYDEQ